MIKGCPCIFCERMRLKLKKENNMRLTCKLENQKTLADLEPGIAAETVYGIRWRDTNGFVFGIMNGYPIVMNSCGNNSGPIVRNYKITGKILGKINMKFEDV